MTKAKTSNAKSKKSKVQEAPKPYNNIKKMPKPGEPACSFVACGGAIYRKTLCRYHHKVLMTEGGHPEEKNIKLEQLKKADIEKRRLQALKSLSSDDLRKMFLTPCKNRSELMNFVKFFFGLHLPDVNVSRFTDTNPFDALWELYQLTVLEKDLGVKELIYCASRGSGKCNAKDTLILTSGGSKYIQDVKVGDTVFTGWSWQPVLETFDEGIKDGVRITTKVSTKQGALDLTGSLKHRIQALDPVSGKIDWIYMKDLVPGQIVYKSGQSNISIDTISEEYEKGWLAGAITGDGCISVHNSHVEICGADFKQNRHYANLVYKYFQLKSTVRRNSKKSVTLKTKGRSFRDWYTGLVEGNLSYFKKLKNLDHTPNFLAGFISGLMDTDGSKDSITLANPNLIKQIGTILATFGVHTSINTNRRKPSTTKFCPGHIVEYSLLDFKSKLPDYLLPMFSKRQAFLGHRQKINEQFRYPTKIISVFGSYIKEKYTIGNGFWSINGVKQRSHVKYSDDLWSKNPEKHIYGYKIDYFISLAEELNENSWAEYLRFIRNGYFETIDSVEFTSAYFYDMEVAVDHSYWANGFISHNTLAVAIAQLLAVVHGKRDVVHVGAIMSQAQRCYEYVQGFLLGDKVRPIVVPENALDSEKMLLKDNMTKSLLKVGGRNCSIEILPCTLRAVNGPHVSFVTVDEVDTLATGEAMRAYKDISGMLDSRDGRKAIRVNISTRKSRYGLMNELMENADKQGKTVRRWTVFEFMSRCPDSRSGLMKQNYFIDQMKADIKTVEQFALVPDNQKKEYVEHEMFIGCYKCPLAFICLGDAKKQTSRSPMLKTIDEVAQKVLGEGPDWALSQLMNLKPSVEGIVYKEFDERQHVKTWNQMWETLTGTVYPGTCDHDTFVKKCHSMGLQAFAGIDWGWSNPSTIVVLFVDKRENIYIVKCDGQTYTSNPSWIHHIKTKYHNKYRVSLYFPDNADPGNLQEMKKAGLAASDKAGKSKIETGIQVVKKWLRAPGSATAKIFMVPETCAPLIKEFQVYHFKTSADGTVGDDIDTESDHWLDALRYTVEGIFGKSQVLLSSESMESYDTSTIVNSRGEYLKPPSPQEWCQANNVTLNPTADQDKIGKIGRLSDLEGAADDEEDGFSSGFLWSF